MNMIVMQDLFETVGPAIDGIKFVGGSLHVLTRTAAVELVEISHTRFVYVCESGLLQHALAQVQGFQAHTCTDLWESELGESIGNADPKCHHLLCPMSISSICSKEHDQCPKM